MMRLLIVYYLVLIAVVACYSRGSSNNSAFLPCGQSNPYGVRRRVVGGRTALPGAWPWQAILLYGFFERFRCSGALIHPSWILTAAHCISSNSPRMYKIRLGDFDRYRYEGREQTIRVERVVKHPEHNRPVRRNNDIALIKLSRPATLNRWVGTVCLPTAADYLHQDLRCYATGWGLTGRGYSHSRMLQQAHVPLVTKYKCRKRADPWFRYGRRSAITYQMLCGGDDTSGASACMGDSGGPYVCRNPQGYWVLQGITSWGSSSCKVSERYSVFAKVHVFTSWIEKSINTTTSPEKATSRPRFKDRPRIVITEETAPDWHKALRNWLARWLG